MEVKTNNSIRTPLPDGDHGVEGREEGGGDDEGQDPGVQDPALGRKLLSCSQSQELCQRADQRWKLPTMYVRLDFLKSVQISIFFKSQI